MSPYDMYSVLALLLQAQKSGIRLLEFTIAGIFSSDVGVEQQVSKSPTASPNDVAPPIINPPQLSESVIRVALENASIAGHLSISDATDIGPPNQVLQHASQQSGEAETCNPNPKKRRREEPGASGANVKRMKNKVAFPIREQSSR